MTMWLKTSIVTFVMFSSTVFCGNILHFIAKKTAEDVVCPDGGQCPADSTCCKLTSGKYGCCPMPDATCCEDLTHCCPSGYKCDVTEGQCVRGSDKFLSLTTIQRLSPVPKPLGDQATDISCPGGQQSCPDGSTCCELSSGQYGCCPLTEAVCCSDHLHCCPKGYTCDVQRSQCRQGSKTIQWSLKLSARASVDSVNIPGVPVAKTSSNEAADVTCPGGQQSCPDGSTCCQLSSGQYGCCPLVQAVCCSDHLHCCPNGYTCDVQEGQCRQGPKSIQWSLKMPAREPTASPYVVDSVKVSDVVSSQLANACLCGKGSSCCGEKCCPFENGVCCAGSNFCCPSGTTCDEKAQSCKSTTSSLETSWNAMHKQSVLNLVEKAEDITCPDQSHCQDDGTCCELATGQYGCCPYSDATCCSDRLHCCPHGMQCDVEHSKCVQTGLTLPWELHSRRRARKP